MSLGSPGNVLGEARWADAIQPGVKESEAGLVLLCAKRVESGNDSSDNRGRGTAAGVSRLCHMMPVHSLT